MKLIIDVDGNVGFDDWFDEEDVDDIVDALNSIGIGVEIDRVDYEFKTYPILKKKERFASIPITARNIFLILSNFTKTNEEIMKILGIERDSDFIITFRKERYMTEFKKWEKIDNAKQWADEVERMKAFAGYYESKKKMSNKKIIKIIKKMVKDGCLQLADEKFPECKLQFNTECISCQFGSKYIKTQADAERFGEVLNKDFE